MVSEVEGKKNMQVRILKADNSNERGNYSDSCQSGKDSG